MYQLSKAEKKLYTSILTSAKQQYSNKKEILDELSYDAKRIREKVYAKYKYKNVRIPISEILDLTEKILYSIEKSGIKVERIISEKTNTPIYKFKVLSLNGNINQAVFELVELITINLKENHVKEFKIQDIEILYDEYSQLHFNFIAEKIFHANYSEIQNGYTDIINKNCNINNELLSKITFAHSDKLNIKLTEDEITNNFTVFFESLNKNGILLEKFDSNFYNNYETYSYNIPTVIVPTNRYYKEILKEILLNISNSLQTENINKLAIDKINLNFKSEKGNHLNEEIIEFEIIGMKEFSNESIEDSSEVQENSKTFETINATINTTLEYKKELMERFNNFLLSLDNLSENSVELGLKLIEIIAKNKI